MKKLISNCVLILTFSFLSFASLESFEANKVEALGDISFCSQVAYTIKSDSPIYPQCNNTAKTLVFNFDYQYNVTGISSGADGY